jgi:hypothetical protein
MMTKQISRSTCYFFLAAGNSATTAAAAVFEVRVDLGVVDTTLQSRQ